MPTMCQLQVITMLSIMIIGHHLHLHDIGRSYIPHLVEKNDGNFLNQLLQTKQTTGTIINIIIITVANKKKRFLTSPEKMDRLHHLQHQKKLSMLRIKRLKSKIASIIASQGVPVDDEITNDIEAIMLAEEEHVLGKFAEGSFQQIFWQQQKLAASKSDKRGMRWHPLMIKWCLFLRHQSSKAYETLRESGCLSLPSQRTLRDYSNCVKAGAGFSVEVDCQLMQAANVTTCLGWQKLVILLLDEIHIREDLVYNKHTGKMIGFCNLGEINNRLLEFERSMEEKEGSCSPILANSMMVFMVRGVFTPLRCAI